MRNSTSKVWFFLSSLPVWTGALAYADAIQGLTFTDVVSNVTVIDAVTKQESVPKVGDVLVAPNVLKTGPDSRAELVAEDKTVTRVGSNTIFSVEANSRDVNLAQGSVLFNAPKGKGGGRIKSAGATASVLGTTFITSASPSGGFKVMGLEGSVKVDGSKGGSAKIGAGQLSFALPGGKITPPMNFDLKGQVGGSKLVGGFSKPLASIAKIEAAIAVQQAKIASGALASTGLLLGDRPNVAFQVDVSQIQSVVTEVVAQVKAAKETVTPSSNVVDPRFLKAVQERLTLLPASDTTGVVSTWSRYKAGETTAYKGLRRTEGFDQTLWFQSTGTMPLLSQNGVDYTYVSGATTTVAGVTLETYQGADGSILKFKRDTQGTALGNVSYPLLKQDGGSYEILGQVAPDSHVFEFSFKNGKGVTIDGYSLLSAIPGDRVGLGTHDQFVSVLVANDIELKLNPLDSQNPGAFLLAPAGENKEGGAIIALNDLRLSGSVELAGYDTVITDSILGTKTGTPLLLSAGNTLTLGAGTLLRADTSLFEIYAAGTGFTPNQSLSELAVATKTTLTLDQVALVNGLVGMDAMLRIKAPAIKISDSFFRVLPEDEAGKFLLGSLVLESSGDIEWSTSTASARLTKPVLVPLGFSAGDVSAEAFNVRVTSTRQAVNLGNVNLATNDARFSAGSTLSLTDVTFSHPDYYSDTLGLVRTLAGASVSTVGGVSTVSTIAGVSTVSTKGGVSTVTVSDTSVLGVGMLITGDGIPAGTTVASVIDDTKFTLNVPADSSVKSTAADQTVVLGLPTTFISGIAAGDINVSRLTSPDVVSTYLNSTGGKVSVTDSTFGSVYGVGDRDPVTSFIAKAAAELALTGTTVKADSVELFGGADVTMTNVIVAPTDSFNGTVSVTSANTKNITVNSSIANKAAITAYAISVNAGGDLNINGKLVPSGSDAYTLVGLDGSPISVASSPKLEVTANTFKATAKDLMTVNRVDFNAVQDVSLSATTLVIRNTDFAADSKVGLKSASGNLAARPGSNSNSIQRGLVNIMGGVTYGGVTINLPDAGSAMNDAAFHAASQAKFSGADPFAKITIGTK